MPIVPQHTPNPNAMKFSVGVEVGGPRSYVAANAGDDALASELFGIEGVASVFMTADFVTVTKEPGADWAGMVTGVEGILERHFPAG